MTTGSGNPNAESGGRMASLVASLRSSAGEHKSAGDGASVRRSEDLDVLLPEGHRARLIWDYVVGGPGRDASRMAHFEGGAAALPARSLLAIWVYALSKGIGNARELAGLCRHHAGFRWLCAGVPVDAAQLVEFRMQSPNAVDELLAECLASLHAGGLTGPRQDAPVAGGSQENLLSLLSAAQIRVHALREKLDAPAEEVIKRRQVIADRRRSERQAKSAAALAALARLGEVQNERQRQLEQARRKAVQARALPPKPVVVRPLIGREPDLPWSREANEDRQYHRFTGIALLVLALLSVVLLMVKPPPVARDEADKIPPRLAKLVLEKKEIPKPEPVKIEEVKPKEQKPEEVKPEESKPDETKPEIRRDTPKPSPQQVADAREKASKTGLVAMRDQLAALRSLSTESLRQEQESVGMAASGPATERDLIGKVATTGSGGVAGRAIAYGGGGALEGHRTTQVRGGSGSGPSIAEINRAAKSGKRSSEDIKIGFDANKSALYAIYRRALRENPALEGRVVLKLTIDPTGLVTACSVVSSALKDVALEEKLVSRILLINFGARPGVETWSGSYHIDFVPTS